MISPRRLALASLFVLPCAWVALTMGQASANGPFNRDGAHYLFMALNLLDGKTPYWSQFETKNPGVAVYWALWHLAFGGGDVVAAARAAESAVVAAIGASMAAAVWWLSQALSTSRAARLAAALAAGLGGASLLSDWRVTDNGFNTAIYQNLPELACVALGWGLATGRLGVSPWAWVLGLAGFAGWFTKQTVLVSIALPLLYAAWLAPRAAPGIVARALAAFLVPLAAWGAHLVWTGTWTLYAEGTIAYQGLRLSPFDAGYRERFSRLLVDGSWQGIFTWLRWLTLGTALLALAMLVAAGSRCLRRLEGPALPPALAMVTLWACGTLAQALAPGTFFPHYWLALVAPVLTGLALLLLWALPGRAWSALAFVPLAAWAVSWAVGYVPQGPFLRERAAAYPQALRWKIIRETIDLREPTALWGGLPHPWVYANQPSHYPNNMWWSYIRTNRPAESADEALAAKFRPDPPRNVIEFPEDYPPEQQLLGTPLTAARLERWTGRHYCVLRDEPPIGGRYGGRLVIWRQCEVHGRPTVGG